MNEDQLIRAFSLYGAYSTTAHDEEATERLQLH